MRPVLPICRILLAGAAAAARAPTLSNLRSPLAATSALRLRGGASAAAPADHDPTPGKVARARVLMVLSTAIYGTYPVLLRALHVVGGEPMPSAFVTFARYMILTVFAFGLRGLRRWQVQRFCR